VATSKGDLCILPTEARQAGAHPSLASETQIRVSTVAVNAETSNASIGDQSELTLRHLQPSRR
jgi:hypothetical protein